MNSESKPSETSSATKSSAGGAVLKVLLLLVVLLAGAAGVLYALGGSEMEIVVSQDFKGEKGQTFRLTKRVYRLITQPELVQKWVKGIKKIEPIGDIKEHRVGAKSKVTVEGEGGEVVFEDEVVSARLNQETELKMTSEVMDVVQKFEISYKDQAALSGDEITLTHTFRVKFKGAARLFAIFSKSQIEEQLKENLTSLKKLVDAGEGEAPPRQRPGRGGKGQRKRPKGKGRPKMDESKEKKEEKKDDKKEEKKA